MYYDTKAEAWHNTRATLPDRIGQTMGVKNADEAILIKLGIIPAVVDPVEVGMVASGGYAIEIIDGTAHRIPNVITQAEADQIAEDAAIAFEAAELERKSIPQVFDTPIEAQSFVFISHSTGTGYEYFVDDAGDLLKVVAHASPLKTKAERDALKVQAKADRLNAKQDWRNNSGQGQLQKRIAALEAAVNTLMGSE